MTKYTNPLDYLLTEAVITRGFSNPYDDMDFSTDSMELPDKKITGASDEETFGTSDEEPSSSTEPRDIISALQKKISDLKEEITEKLKPLYPEDKDKDLAEALDDATSALDLASHHLTDVDNALSDSTETTTDDEQLPSTENVDF